MYSSREHPVYTRQFFPSKFILILFFFSSKITPLYELYPNAIVCNYLGLLGGLETNLLNFTYGLGLYVDLGLSSFISYFFDIKACSFMSCFNLVRLILSSFKDCIFKCLAVWVKLLPIRSDGLKCKSWR